MRILFALLLCLACAKAAPAYQDAGVTIDIHADHWFHNLTDISVSDHGKVIVPDQTEEPFHPVKQFLPGLKTPHWMLYTWTGGAHCCFDLVFIWVNPTRVVSIPVLDTDLAQVKQNPKSGVIAITTADYAFQDWRVPFAFTPTPIVSLSIDPATGKITADMPAMAHPAPTESQLLQFRDAFWARMRQEYTGGGDDWLLHQHSSDLWRIMLNEIYAGNPAAARHYLDLAWPTKNTTESKQQFLACFSHQLNGGSLWQQFSLGKVFHAQAYFPDQPCPDS